MNQNILSSILTPSILQKYLQFKGRYPIKCRNFCKTIPLFCRNFCSGYPVIKRINILKRINIKKNICDQIIFIQGGDYLSETKKEENYIIIPNYVFNDALKYQSKHLTVDELYLYAWLYRNRIPDNWITRTSVDMINNLCYKFANGDESRNKRTIKKLLINLKDKGYIVTVGVSNIHEKMKNSDSLEISFPSIDSSNGYNGNITYSIFDKFKDPLEFFIYAYIDCFGDKGRSLSYYKWAKLTKRSESTIKNVVEKMNSYQFDPRIWKFSGDYYQNEYGDVRQCENVYYTRPNNELIKKWNGFYIKDENEWELAYRFEKNKDKWGDEYPF